MKKTFFTTLLLMALFIAGCEIPKETSAPVITGEMDVVVMTTKGNEKVRVEIADSDEERMRGYMYRDTIPEGTGMWFIFNMEQPLSFWMKNTKVSLDIIFLDKNFKIVNIVQGATPCQQEPCTYYRSQGNAQYVLEVPAGYSEQHHFEVGNSIFIQ